ncbi:endonuclease V [Halobacteriales archaeon QS_3_64_16]|nr:MAG: endonuclease V [Halobacteriales archaeon QS_3_64_16]
MEPKHPEFVPDPTDSRERMEALQREIAERALFADDLEFDPQRVSVRTDESAFETDTDRTARPRSGSELEGDADHDESTSENRPIVAGVDQALLDDRAVSAIVCLRGGEVVERAYAVVPLGFPYVPGLLSFREGGPILAAFAELENEPDLVCFDGSGRIHFREAGLATHIGLALDVPATGVAKSLLCGTPRESLDDRETGTRVAIEADAEMTAPPGTVIGYAVQTKQFSGTRYVNPLYVSPGHRVGAGTAADLVLALAGEYKLPEPTRQADAYAAELKEGIE